MTGGSPIGAHTWPVRAVLHILTLTVLAQTATADLVHVSSERILRARGLDGTGGEVFKAEQVRNDTGDWDEIDDGFGFVDGNFIAGSMYQRSNIDPVLTPVVPNSLMLLQGSAALATNIGNESPLSAEATSSASYTFSTDVAATVRIIWSLEAGGLADPRAELGPASFSFRDESAAAEQSIIRRSARVGNINTGFVTLGIDPGEYTLAAGAFATLYQGELPGGTPSVLPGDAEQSGGYTVTIALLPTPGSVLPLTMAGLLVSRRRRN